MFPLSKQGYINGLFLDYYIKYIETEKFLLSPYVQQKSI